MKKFKERGFAIARVNFSFASLYSLSNVETLHPKVPHIWNLWHIPDTRKGRYHQQSLTEPYRLI
ncbi:hypothetical protein [Scytonema sp. PCC 10023]|uniref:hypothetical protein n=1 Tax=Scytonema sp. PCC 10023 TaxID=1680591 RepID=UPI0039C72833